MPAWRPTQFFHSGLSSIEDALRFRSDKGVFAIRFVPHRHDFDAVLRQHLEGSQLSLRLMGESVPDAERKSLECQHDVFFPEVETGENRDATRPIWQWRL